MEVREWESSYTGFILVKRSSGVSGAATKEESKISLDLNSTGCLKWSWSTESRLLQG